MIKGGCAMFQVLIVDDEPFVRQGLKVLIDWELYGFEICGEAKNGIEALEFLENNKVDLIITDIKMPGMDGLKMVEKIRQGISKRVKIILLSGFSEFSYAQEAMKYNINHYLLKPIQPSELIRVITEIRAELQKQVKAAQIRQDTASVVGAHYLLEILAGHKNDKLERGLLSLFQGQKNMIYLHIEMDPDDKIFEGLMKEEQKKEFWKLYDVVMDIMGGFKGNVVCNVNNNELFEIGVIVSEELAATNEEEQVDKYATHLCDKIRDASDYRLRFYLGDMVDDISEIEQAYISALEKKVSQENEVDVELLSIIEKEVKVHYMNNLSLKDMSEKYFINSAYLGQLFKKKYGVYFKDYLNTVRIQKAKELLLTTHEKIYKIAEMVGYNNVDYFINKFTKEIGVTPNKFRYGKEKQDSE